MTKVVFRRQSNSGHKVEWVPDDDELAEQAAQTVAEDNGIESIGELLVYNEKYDYDYLPANIYNSLREEYEELHVEKYGKDSQFHDEDA